MTKEQIYQKQLQALEIYDPVFDPEIKTLARLERELTRAQKAWSATASPPGSAPSFTDPHYPIIQKLRAEILQHREALGLTPKALKKIKGSYYETVRAGELAEDKQQEEPTVLDFIRDKYAI